MRCISLLQQSNDTSKIGPGGENKTKRRKKKCYIRSCNIKLYKWLCSGDNKKYERKCKWHKETQPYKWDNIFKCMPKVSIQIVNSRKEVSKTKLERKATCNRFGDKFFQTAFISLNSLQICQTTCLHPSFPLLCLMAIKVKQGLSREWRLVIMLLQRSHCWSYDKKKVQKEKKIAIVALFKEKPPAKTIFLVNSSKWFLEEKHND